MDGITGTANPNKKLDQHHDVVFDQTLASATAGTSPSNDVKIDLAQTFTVGVSGRLKEVQLYAQPLSGSPPSKTIFFIDIRPTVNDVPVEDNSKAYLVLEIPMEKFVPDQSGYISFDLTRFHLKVTKGQVLAMVLRSDNGRANVNGNISNPYSGGRAYTRYLKGVPNNTWLGGFGAQPDWDFGFRTYVDPGPVPGPAK